MRAGERQKIDNCSLVVTPIIGSGGKKMFEDANGYKTTQLFREEKSNRHDRRRGGSRSMDHRTICLVAVQMFWHGIQYSRRNWDSTICTGSLVQCYDRNFEFRALFYVPFEKSSPVVRFRGNEVGAGCCLLIVMLRSSSGIPSLLAFLLSCVDEEGLAI